MEYFFINIPISLSLIKNISTGKSIGSVPILCLDRAFHHNPAFVGRAENFLTTRLYRETDVKRTNFTLQSNERKKKKKFEEIVKFNIATIKHPLLYETSHTGRGHNFSPICYAINSNLFELESFHSLKPFTDGETFS